MKLICNLQFFGGRGSSGGKRSGGSSSGVTRTIRGKEYTVGESIGFRETEKRIMLDNGDRIIPNGNHIIESEQQTSNRRVSIYESQKGNIYEISYSTEEYSKFGSTGVSVKATSVRKVTNWR